MALFVLWKLADILFSPLGSNMFLISSNKNKNAIIIYSKCCWMTYLFLGKLILNNTLVVFSMQLQ